MVDNLYVQASNIFTKVSAKEASVKSLVYTSEYENKKQLYALVCESLKHSHILLHIAQALKILEDKPYGLFGNMALLQVLLYDIIFGKGIHKSRRFKNTMRKYRQRIREYTEYLTKEKGLNCVQDLLFIRNLTVTSIPKYVRVNRLKTRMKDACKQFKEDGYRRLHRKGKDYSSFLEEVKSLKSEEFIRDIHIPSLIVFPPGKDFHDHPLYKSGEIILQDKASCFSSQILCPPEGSTVIDCCAAPGNKTTHLASLMNNSGKIFAFDKDAERLKILEKFVQKSGTEIVESFCKDFLTTNPNDPKFQQVEYILVDPSCSGSGIVSRLDEAINSAETSKHRLKKLSRFQISILKHALCFPNVKKVVYSTCSIFVEENEEVVEEVIKHFQDKFSFTEIMPDFMGRGASSYPNSHHFIRWSTDKDLTNGFFVACFERRIQNEDNTQNCTKDLQNRKRKHSND